MNKERIWTLMARKLAGEATDAELNELHELVSNNDTLSNTLPDDIDAYWKIPTENDADFLEATYHLHVSKLKKMGYDLESVHEEASSEFNDFLDFTATKKRKKLILLASCLFAICFICFFVFKQNSSTDKAAPTLLAQSKVTTKNGSRTKIQLPDGTSVWLNSSSELLYNNDTYGKTIREVTLIGEGYFDVVRNPDKPFIIHTTRLDIKVLGTAFNVKSYPDEISTETSLIRGSLEVNLKDRHEKIMMKPNDKLIFNSLQDAPKKIIAGNKPLGIFEKQKPIIELSHLTIYPLDNSIVETAWVENKLVFRNESLEDIALKMERWYGVSIDISTESLKKELITGSFEKETVYQALKALQFTNKFHYTTENDKIIISK